jgi:hypothetical protein
MLYPMYNTGKPDLDNGSPVDDDWLLGKFSKWER